MPGWDKAQVLIKTECEQSIEEGKDPAAVEALRAECAAAGDDAARLQQLHGKFLALPVRADFGFEEPSDLENIRRLRPANRRPLTVSRAVSDLADKLHGAWLGRCVGCALGKPVEAYMGQRNGLRSWERQRAYLTAIAPDEWPLRDYYPARSPAGELAGELMCPQSTREHIAFMETDDDIRYTVLGQIILEQHGRDFTTLHVAREWLKRLTYIQVCTAETQAYRNLTERYEFHINATPAADIDWHWVATRFNPFREWIGAQIRVDSYGYAAPGNPELAAEFAWRDARLSHVKNGIYGAMFCAAMIAAAFATDDPAAIIEAGLAEIPATSRLYADVRRAVEICQRHGCDAARFEAVFGEIYDLLGHYSPVHTNNNAAMCAATLLLSGGDFAKGVTLAVMGGWDTDCNGATVGSMVGAISGATRAPAHWTARLHDTLNAELAGYHPIAISECAKRSLNVAQAILPV
ncbi:MAG: ADP-ribosylglycohydrolase family protein [Verrucomicrobiales bacterium]|jgi:ADP-ribosylglycohydrolase|nr:ADP-ribosylglycohydrolase family protein [Verrucomicrobiales bacterium]